MKKFAPALLLAIAAPLAAQSAQDPAAGFMKQFDVDGNGKVSLDEFRKPQMEAMAQQLDQQFRYMDKNSDGGVDDGEISSFTMELQERMKQMQQEGGPGGQAR